MSNFDVCGIGNAIVDVLVHTEDQFLKEFNLVKGSMKLISMEEANFFHDRIQGGKEVSGGSAANTMAGISAFGGKACFMGKVADDNLGHSFSKDIKSIGVEFLNEPLISNDATARCYIFVTDDGERTMNTFLGASVDFSEIDIQSELIERSKITYLEGYLWDKPSAKNAFLKASRIAKLAGKTVALTLSDSFCVDRHRDSFKELIKNDVDVLFANESEIKSLYEVTDIFEAAKRVANDCRLSFLTRSENGSLIIFNGVSHSVPAHKVEKLIDTTGSGDLYAAGVLFGLSQDLELTRCAELGSFAASLIIEQLGARSQLNLQSIAVERGLL